MFKESLNQQHEREPRFKQAPVSQEPLQPDSSQRVGWFRRQLDERLFWVSRVKQKPPALRPEVFVPEGRVALLIQDGRPERWFQPGRHSLSAAKAKVEVRLIAADSLSDPQRHQPDLSLPYERAFLYVDGVLVCIVKPGYPSSSPSQGDHGSGLAAPFKAQNLPQTTISEGEDDLLQDFSFV